MSDFWWQGRELVVVEPKHLQIGEVPNFGWQGRELVVVELEHSQVGQASDFWWQSREVAREKQLFQVGELCDRRGETGELTF